MKYINIIYIVLAIIVVLFIAIVLWRKLKKKTVYTVERTPGKIKIKKESDVDNKKQEIEIEESDLAYYQKLDSDINTEFKLRNLWYEQPKVTHTRNLNNTEGLVLDYDNLPYHLLWELDEQPGVDHQNVHDTYVQNSIRNLYNNNTYQNQHNNQTNQIDLSPDVSHIVNKIKNRNSYISNLDNNEYNVLLDVYNQAQTNENIKENLIWQLKDCMNGDNLYCPTGVTSRIIAALAIEHPEDLPKDKNTVNTEVLAKFSALTNAHPELDKHNIKDLVLSDYNSDQKTQELVDACINEWIDHV